LGDYAFATAWEHQRLAGQFLQATRRRDAGAPGHFGVGEDFPVQTALSKSLAKL
jgi:hypothetical protein